MGPLKILKSTEDQKRSILKALDISEKQLEENVQIIQNWIKTQPHIPEFIEATIIRLFLIMNKFRLEKVKERMTTYFLIRSAIPEIFNVYPNDPKFLSNKNTYDYGILRDLTPDLSRVVLFRLKDETEDLIDPLHCLAYMMLVTEVRLREDFRVRDIFVYDLKNVKLSHLKKLSPLIILKISTIMSKLYNDNGAIINLINVPAFALNFMGVLKRLHPGKTQDRFFIHDSLESLYKIVPKDILPSEYGGSTGTVNELIELWDKKLEEYEPIFDRLRKIKIDKDLLPENLKIEYSFGVHGNFQKLEID